MMATAGTAGRAGGFEIGLVMAGAVSAGAYTAGVVDFLIQALDQWHATPLTLTQVDSSFVARF
jgi:hypothetical protein